MDWIIIRFMLYNVVCLVNFSSPFKQCTFDASVDEHSTISFHFDLYHHYHRQYKVNGILC